MKATILLIVIVALAMAVLAAQPVEPGAGLTRAASHVNDPLWMTVSGAALLSLASALRRYMP